MYDIYYAHHNFQHNTSAEMYELELIKKYFSNATIFNPLDASGKRMENISQANIFIFSSMNGIVDFNTYSQIMEATRQGKIMFYIYQNRLNNNFTVSEIKKEDQSVSVYGVVDSYFYN